MYKSPIDIIYGQMEKQMEGDILRAVQSYGINVDKVELIRALQYDRAQYEKGYADAKAEVVHGRWEKEDQSGISIDGYMVCSACNVMIPKPDYNRYCLHRLNFCPNCGADMRGDRDGRKDP